MWFHCLGFIGGLSEIGQCQRGFPRVGDQRHDGARVFDAGRPSTKACCVPLLGRDLAIKIERLSRSIKGKRIRNEMQSKSRRTSPDGHPVRSIHDQARPGRTS